jgi:hypothetical protein
MTLSFKDKQLTIPGYKFGEVSVIRLLFWSSSSVQIRIANRYGVYYHAYICSTL